MSDPIRVPTLESIPEPLQAHFAPVETDGGTQYEYRPPSSKTDLDVQRLNGALNKERERAKQLAAQLEQRTAKVVIDDEEIDTEEVQAAIRAHRQQRGTQTLSMADAEKLIEQRVTKVRSAAQKELDELKVALAERDSALDSALIDSGIVAAVSSADAPVKFRPEAIEDLRDYVRGRGLVKRNGSQVEVYDLDGKTPLVNAKGDPGTLADLLALVASRKPHWVVESQGSNSTPPLNGSAPKKKRSDMNMDEKIAFISKYGEDAYISLPN